MEKLHVNTGAAEGQYQDTTSSSPFYCGAERFCLQMVGSKFLWERSKLLNVDLYCGIIL
jgi:hypothetical protein